MITDMQKTQDGGVTAAPMSDHDIYLFKEGSHARLYEKLGFSTISSRKGYYPRPDGSAATALVMARDLG